MSRLMTKYFDIASAAAKLSGVANSLGSLMFAWLCIATRYWCLSANGATRCAAFSVADAVMKSAPNALAIRNPRSISSSVKLSLKLRL